MDSFVSVSTAGCYGRFNFSHDLCNRHTRITKSVPKLQRVLISGLQAGIIPFTRRSSQDTVGGERQCDDNNAAALQDVETLNAESLLMPESWVKGKQSNCRTIKSAIGSADSNCTFVCILNSARLMAYSIGAIAVRINSLLRGHSGCRVEVVEMLHKLLLNNIVPCPPLRYASRPIS